MEKFKPCCFYNFEAMKNLELNKTLFAILITLNAISIILTFCLISFGGKEANPIAYNMVKINPYLFVSYALILWILAYYIIFKYLPNKIGKMANKFATLCLSFLISWFFIDALHDTILFTSII